MMLALQARPRPAEARLQQPVWNQPTRRLNELPLMTRGQAARSPAARPMVTDPGADHQPCRPSWDCSACGKPWPCDPARETLAQRHDRQGLAVHLADWMIEAARDMPSTAPGELFDRFMAWTRTQP